MKIKSLILSTTLLACLVTGSAQAASFEGQTFEDGIHLGNRDLRLNGMGIRAVLFIRAYVAGLYLSEPGNSWEQVLTMTGPKRLQMRMLRSAGPSDFNNALVAGIRKNASEAELAQLSERIKQLERTIEAVGTTVAGDVINLDYLPEQGTVLSVNGAAKGTAIAGADFFNAVLGIFVGDKPVDKRLKKGLLGQ